MAKSGQRSSPPPPSARSAPISSRLSPVAAIGAEAQKAAKELVVDDFVDTYLRERPKTRNPYEAATAAREAAATLRATSPAAPPVRPAEESGVRVAIGHALRQEVEPRRPTVEIEVAAVAEQAGEVVALEAELADRDARISSLEEELKRLRDSVSNEGSSGEQRSRTADPAPLPEPDPTPASSPAPAPAPDQAPRPASRAAGGSDPAASALPTGRRGRMIAGVGLLVAAVATLAIGLSGLSEAPAAPEQPAAAPAAETAAAPAPAAKAVNEEARLPAEGEPIAPAAAAAAPPAAAGPTAPAEASARVDDAPPPEPVDSPGLLSFQGHLTIQSSRDAQVVVQGQPAGRTNERLLTRCGPRNVRLRDESGWITKGQHVRIACMKHTTVRIEPR